MEFAIDTEGDLATIRFTGQLKMADGRAVQSALRSVVDRKAVHRIRVDLSAVDYIDSSGLATLIDASDRFADRGGTMTLAGVRPSILAVFEMMGLAELFVFE